MEKTKIAKIIEGLQILSRHNSDADLGFEHDVIYVQGSENLNDNHADLVKMEELGWHWSEEFEGWSHF